MIITKKKKKKGRTGGVDFSQSHQSLSTSRVPLCIQISDANGHWTFISFSTFVSKPVQSEKKKKLKKEIFIFHGFHSQCTLCLGVVLLSLPVLWEFGKVYCFAVNYFWVLFFELRVSLLRIQAWICIVQ